MYTYRSYFTITFLLLAAVCPFHVNAKMCVAIEKVVVHSAEGDDQKAIGAIKKGTVIDVTPISDHWGTISYHGKTGYVSNEFLDDAPSSETPPPAPTAEKKGLSLNEKKQIAFVIGFIIFLFILKRVYNWRTALTDKRRKAADHEEEMKYVPKYWYQCRHCQVAVRRESEPNSMGCFNAPDHNWTEIAEYGKQRYFCTKCQLAINTKGVPIGADCPQGDGHAWELLTH
jgi:uncharacterized protein YgiM (DUF1202 family)